MEKEIRKENSAVDVSPGKNSQVLHAVPQAQTAHCIAAQIPRRGAAPCAISLLKGS